jgi:hypothetical protein
MRDNYIIYKAENLLNGKVYIGATTYSVEQRKLDHVERAVRGEKNKFHEAISTYGIDAFTWEQIDTAESIDELAKKEKKYVLRFRAKEDGFNSDEGGGFKKRIYQFSLLDGSLLFTYDNLHEAANSIGSTKQHISRACLSINKSYGGYYWSYEFPFNPKLDKRFKAVEQIGNDGNVIAKYKSIAEAAYITGVSKNSIAKVCRGERKLAGGVYWRVI